MPTHLPNDTVGKILEFFKQYPIVTFEEGEKILRPGEKSSSVYCVKSGNLRVYTIAENGKEITADLLNPKNQMLTIIGYSNILEKYYVEAITPVEVYKVPSEDFAQLLIADPTLFKPLIEYSIEVIRQLMKQIEWLTMGNAYTRVATILYSLSLRYGENRQGNIHITVRPTHQIIASLAGISRETVTLQMNELEKKGILSYEGKRLIIKSLEKLKNEAIASN